MKIMTRTGIMVILIGTEMKGVNRYRNDNRNKDNGNKYGNSHRNGNNDCKQGEEQW